MHTPTRAHWARPLVAVGIFALALGATACSGDVVSSSTPVPTAAGSPTALGAAPTEAMIELTADGFVPDQVEVAEGSRVLMRNATDSTVTFIVKGREDGASEDELTVEPGQSVDLRLVLVGAYILTLTNDPMTTAGVFIS